MQTTTDTQSQRLEQLRKRISRRFLTLKIFLAVFAGLATVVILLAFLLLRKPADFNQPDSPQDKEVSKYLTHVISQDIYNGAQTQKPFDLIITEEGINDIILRSGWPKQMDSVSFTVPQVLLQQGQIVLRGLVKIQTIELFISIQAGAFLDQQQLMHLSVNKVRVGAVNMLPIVRLAAEGIFRNEADRRKLEPDDWRTKVMQALLYDIPFEPIFKIEENKIRIQSADLQPGRITLHFIPVQ